MKIIINLFLIIVFGSFTMSNAQSSNKLNIEAIPLKYSGSISCDGSYKIVCYDGTEPFQYSNNAGRSFQDNPIFEEMCDGEYFIQVKDATGKIGLTLIKFFNLESNNTNELTKEERDAIRQSTINDLMQQRESVINNWEERRFIEYKLSRLNVTFPIQIINETEENQLVIKVYKMILPSNADDQIVSMHFQRMKEIFKDYITDIQYDNLTWNVTIKHKKNMSIEKLNQYYTLNGFSNIN